MRVADCRMPTALGGALQLKGLRLKVTMPRPPIAFY